MKRKYQNFWHAANTGYLTESILFHDKNIQQARNRRKLPHPDKEQHQKLIANITLKIKN